MNIVAGIYILAMLWLFLATYGWRLILIAVAVPALILGISGYFILPESPRWLLTEGRTEEASEMVDMIIKYNKAEIKELTYFEKEFIVDKVCNGYTPIISLYRFSDLIAYNNILGISNQINPEVLKYLKQLKEMAETVVSLMQKLKSLKKSGGGKRSRKHRQRGKRYTKRR
jgi:MFS family permease